MSKTRSIKSNQGTSGDQCPRNTEKIPSQAPRLVRIGKKTATDGVRMTSSWLIMQSFMMW